MVDFMHRWMQIKQVKDTWLYYADKLRWKINGVQKFWVSCLRMLSWSSNIQTSKKVFKFEFIFDPSKFDFQIATGLNSAKSVLWLHWTAITTRGAINRSKCETYLLDTVRVGALFTSCGPGVYSNYTSVVLGGYYEFTTERLVPGSDQSAT